MGNILRFVGKTCVLKLVDFTRNSFDTECQANAKNIEQLHDNFVFKCRNFHLRAFFYNYNPLLSTSKQNTRDVI